MSGYPTRFWVAAGAVVAAFVGLLAPWVKTIFIDISGLDTDDGKLLAVVALLALVCIVVHARHTARERKPWWPLVALVIAGVLIAAIAMYDWADIENTTSGSEFEGLAKVGWGLWLDALAGIVLAGAAVALLLRRKYVYGKASQTAAAPAPLASPEQPDRSHQD